MLVANQSSEENIVKRNVVFGFGRLSWFELEARNNHSRDPEEDNVRRSDEHACRIKFLPRLRIHRFIRPEPRRKPSVQRIPVLFPILNIERRLEADIDVLVYFGFSTFDFRFSIPRRDSMSP